MSDHSCPRMLGIGSVMILEDDGLLSMMMEDMVLGLGAREVHVCVRSDQAISIANETRLDCAILDVLVHGTTTYEVADALHQRGVPFIFCSGVAESEVDLRHRHRPFLAKPYSDDDLKACLRRALETEIAA